MSSQYRTFVAFKIAIEDWSVYQRVSIMAMNWIFLQNGFNQNLETRAWHEENLPRIHWITNFAQSRTFAAFKIAIEDWSVHKTRVNNRYKLNFFLQNGLTKVYNLGLKMKKNYQGYIESENFGQSWSFAAFKMAEKTGWFTGASL